MPRYPDDPRPNTGYAFRSNWPTNTGGPEWAPQSRPLTRFGLAEADLSYKAKTWAQIKTLYDFFESVKGSSGRFTFVDFNGIGKIGGTDPGVPWSGLYVAKADGVTFSWDLPTFGLKANLTTVAGSIASGTRTVTPASMAGIAVGDHLTAVDADGTVGEVVVVTAITGTTFSAVFANAHASDWIVGAPVVFENGVAKMTEIISVESDPAFLYHINAGLGTDGVDALIYGIPSTVATAPSPATSGTSLVVFTGAGVNFPATPFYANVWPASADPIGPNDPNGRTVNIEIIQVTGITTDTLTIVRAQGGTSARTIIVGDQIAIAPVSAIIVSVDAICRRAMRRARFTTIKNPFVYDVPAVYTAGTLSVCEVRK